MAKTLIAEGGWMGKGGTMIPQTNITKLVDDVRVGGDIPPDAIVVEDQLGKRKDTSEGYRINFSLTARSADDVDRCIGWLTANRQDVADMVWDAVLAHVRSKVEEMMSVDSHVDAVIEKKIDQALRKIDAPIDAMLMQAITARVKTLAPKIPIRLKCEIGEVTE